MQRNLKPLLILLLVCLGLILAWPVTGAIKTGYCDFRLRSPRAELAKANANQGKPMPLAQWQTLEKSFKAMNETCAGNPHIPADLANLYLLRAQHAGAVPEVKVFFETIALGYLNQSLLYRPAMAQSWANVAWIKADIGQFDERYLQAMRNALQLAPNNAGVVQTLAMSMQPNPEKAPAAQIAELRAASLRLGSHCRGPFCTPITKEALVR